MSFDWQNAIISDKYIRWISTLGTLGGVVLGFVSLAQSVAANAHPGWAILGLTVGLLSSAQLFSDIAEHFGPPSIGRLVALGYAIALFGIFAGSLGLFVFARPS